MGLGDELWSNTYRLLLNATAEQLQPHVLSAVHLH